MFTKLALTLMLLSASVNPASQGVILPQPLAQHSMPLDDRYSNPYVNGVFKDNILLTLNYLSGAVKSAQQISWDDVEKPFHFEFTLQPGQTFAFHDSLLPEYAGRVVKTTNTHFNYQDGFKSDGYLTGDGVCHLASLIYWTAEDAGLAANAPTNHNFAPIPDVPREFGVAIYVSPSSAASARENLYITNNKKAPVSFIFDYRDNLLTTSIMVD